MPFCSDACMMRMVIRGCGRRNELPMARTYSFHAFPLKFRMGERLMSPRTVIRVRVYPCARLLGIEKFICNPGK